MTNRPIKKGERNINEIIKKIEKIRKIPQFIFADFVNNKSVEKISYKIINFKENLQDDDIKEIDFIVNSPGGLADSSYKIIRTLRNHFEIVNIIVPFWAKSAATLLSLGGSKIIMDEFGEFGPLDAQLAKEKDDSPEFDRESALDDLHSLKMLQEKAWSLYHGMFINLFRSESVQINKIELSQQIFDYIAKFYKPLLEQIDPYRLLTKARKLEIAEKYARRILDEYNNSDLRLKQYLVELLVHNCPDHSYVIDYGTMSKYLNNVLTPLQFAGQEYKKQIFELSRFFMNNCDYQYIGFREQKEGEEANSNEETKDIKKDAEEK